jgi:Zn-dependent protease
MTFNMMNILAIVSFIVVYLLPLILGITVHEMAHGWLAKKYGDNTAYSLGRLTLNPIKHIDLFGTIILPAILLGLLLKTGTGFIFGWAKPIPVDSRYFKNPLRDMTIVALAGPVANLLMAVGWALIIRLGATIDTGAEPNSHPLIAMGFSGISSNLSLVLVNLLPIPPLDGSRILTGMLPRNWAWQYHRLEPYGFYILIALIYFNVMNVLFDYPKFIAEKGFSSIAGL